MGDVPLEQTVFACQTFVIVVPTWLSVLLAGAVIATAILRAMEIYYRRKLQRASLVGHGGAGK